MDITEELEKSFGDGPAHRPVEERITAGRRIVVRRRLAVGAGATAAALVVGGVAWAAVPGGAGGTAPDHTPVATQPPGSTDTTPAAVPGYDPADYLMSDQVVAYGPDGRLLLQKGWRIVERIGNPWGLSTPKRSVGLELTDGKQSTWAVLRFDGAEDLGGGHYFVDQGITTFPAGTTYPGSGPDPTLADWVRAVVESDRDAQQGADGDGSTGAPGGDAAGDVPSRQLVEFRDGKQYASGEGLR